ncbi:MAG: family transcriptional regulator, aerobic/anaerobic benzoate catabolism transcriptional [Thermoanaerobaculia bacterium]|jgi:transcriptional regulator with XRE-family HTH domain|nr:family transcriptional regulator, aerobic/anaerobic benzoate catabolism transcriptional [Thermoanaerobaculia bacterium]
MLGDTVRAARLERGLTQARLAKLAGVSRRHLAALEKGANVSVNVLRKVASVLQLAEISLGEVTVKTAKSSTTSVNMPVLAETIREAHADTLRVQAHLAHAGSILGEGEEATLPVGVMRFPKMQPLRIDGRKRRRAGAAVADGTSESRVPVVGEIRQGEAVVELSGESAPLPSSLVEPAERVFRARGDRLKAVGIEDGDLLIVELRQTGRASSGELVIVKAGELLYIGHWWQKHGRKAIMTDGLSEVTTGGASSKSALKVMAAINAIVRLR